jgi:hypothetical protein
VPQIVELFATRVIVVEAVDPNNFSPFVQQGLS